MAEIVGIALGALLWPWLFGKLFAAAGMQQNGAIWTGYLVAVLTGAGIAGATGWPPGNVGLFALFGLGWAFWRSRSSPPNVKRDEEDDDDNAADDPALVALIGDIESKRVVPGASVGERRSQPSDPIPTSPKFAPAPSASTDDPPRSCAGCGEINDPDADHCINCGKSLREIRCTGCKQLNVAKASFCKRCGVPLASA